MDISDVTAVIAALDAEGVRYWVAGGWGVDALVGWQTRPHRDLDLAVNAADEATALRALTRMEYSIETDQRPARVEVAAAGDRWVDLHPVRFDALGWGRQADLAGGNFIYPPTAFSAGVLAGRPVGCLSASQQLCFRTGYDLRDVDRHDIALLTVLP